MSEAEKRDNRRWFALGALGALVVAIIFATVGDGIETRTDNAIRGFVIEHFHTLTWVLLAVAFGVAAATGRWVRVSSWLALAALACYAVFLLTVIVLE